jgi:hypothetical protein
MEYRKLLNLPTTVRDLMYKNRDVVDSEHSSGSVIKMLLGSFVGDYDQSDRFDDDRSTYATPSSSDSTIKQYTFDQASSSRSSPGPSTSVMEDPFEAPSSTTRTRTTPLDRSDSSKHQLSPKPKHYHSSTHHKTS